MRLFVAILPPSEALDELAAAVAPLRQEAPDLRWAGRQQWHLTLAFLGEVDERVLPELTTRLERAASRHPAQELAFAGGGAFPSARRARVLWSGFRADGRALAALAASVAAGARRAGAPPPDEGRKYHPHLTLAHCRRPADVSGLVGSLGDFAGTSWTAQSVALMRSHLGSGPPRHEELGAWPLRTRRGPDSGPSDPDSNRPGTPARGHAGPV
jgi:RNA 2',3'-cyclic 3'-phosphodiesterase